MGRDAKIKRERQQLDGGAPNNERAIDRRQKIMAAARAGIKPGTYNELQVYDMCDQAVASRDLQWGGWITGLTDIWFKALTLELMLNDIDHQSAVWFDDDLKKRFTEETAGDLMKLFTELATIGQRVEMDMSFISTRVLARVEGIRKLLNENDGGAALRDAMRQDGNFPAMRVAVWRDALNFGGRPTGKTPGQVWLRARWLEVEGALKREKPDTTPRLVRLTLLDELAQQVGDKWIPRADLTDDQRQAFKSLNTKLAKNDPAKFRYELLSRD